MFKNKDLYDIDCICVVRTKDDKIHIYTWKPIIILDKILNNGVSQLRDDIVVDNINDVHGVWIEQLGLVREVFDAYTLWLQRKNDFCMRKFDIIAPCVCYDSNHIAYWKLFCDLFYINSYVKLGRILTEIRESYGYNVETEGFKDMFISSIRNHIELRLKRSGVDDFCISSLCENPLTNIENLGAAYWWFEPDMRKEMALKRLKNNIYNKKYEQELGEGAIILEDF